jgi:glycosyltransferase involved in cell wall biosynthesis
MGKTPILVYRDKLLPISETFVSEPTVHFEHFDAYFFGSTLAQKGIVLPSEKTFVVNPSGVRNPQSGAFWREVGFKLAGILPQDAKAWLDRVAPRLVHAHFAPDGVLAIPVARYLRVPLIVSLLGTDITLDERVALRRSWWGHRLYVLRKKRLFREAAKFLVPSMFLWRKALERGFPEEKMVLLPHGVDLSRFYPRLEQVEFGRVLYVGRLIELKGLPYIMEALAYLRPNYPMIKLVVIGDGPERFKYETLGKRLLGEQIEFMGAQPLEVVAQEMRKAYIFSLPSIEMPDGTTEAFGMVYAEAQASGVPVVAFAVGGVPEVVEHGQTGFLSAQKDVASLAGHIRLLLENPTLRAEMGLKARERAERFFDIKKRAAELEHLYDQVVRGECGAGL